jgi:sugar lactone lactonase YvrE
MEHPRHVRSNAVVTTPSSHPLIPEVFADAATLCGESPLWDAAGNRLLWIDNERGLVFARGLADSSHAVIHEGHPAFAIALAADGRLVCAGPEGVALLDRAGSVTRVLANEPGGDFCFNDATPSPAGGLYGGTFHWGPQGMERTGMLVHVNPAGEPEVQDEGFLLSNGIALDAGGRTLYFADTFARTIYAYDVAPDASLRNRRVFARVDREDGLPDGLAVDAEGHVWCALWYGGAVVRFDPEGRIAARHPLPAQQVASLAFGGPDLAELFVTTGGQYWPSAEEPARFDSAGPMGGAVYRLRPGVTGAPVGTCRFS